MNGEIQLDIDRLDGSQDYVVFIRVQDQGVQRQLYTDGYFFIHLPIQTKNKLNLPIDLLINSLINTTSDYRNDNNEHEKLQKSTNHNSGLYELKIIIVLIISFSLIIILSTIMLFIIISKCRKNKRRKGRNIQRGYIQKTSEEYTTHEAMNGIQGLEKQGEHQQHLIISYKIIQMIILSLPVIIMLKILTVSSSSPTSSQVLLFCSKTDEGREKRGKRGR
ncbi:unnamed protein product [Heterobilharzia americana]|nr:unnamed protein product [Heterobilharzia americana]